MSGGPGGPGGPGADVSGRFVFGCCFVSSPTEFHHQGSIQSISGESKIRLPYLGGRCELDQEGMSGLGRTY